MNNPQTPHIVSAFDEDLTEVRELIRRMGAMTAEQIKLAISAFVNGDERAAKSVIDADKLVDDLEREINDKTIQLIALRQPMADDLRLAISALKIVGSLERIGDYAKNCAKRTRALQDGESGTAIFGIIKRMGERVEMLLRDVLASFDGYNSDVAMQVWAADAEVDAMYAQAHQTILLEMQNNGNAAHDYAHLLFIAKNVERIGDHCTNIAEEVQFFLTGQSPGDERPKADSTSEQ